ncbi:MAG: 30S ribosome-binding factor RbfA [Spirochaetota bacterium]|nr:30S ribosome-binding factor RbfA [Spirochaetota bacterium]
MAYYRDKRTGSLLKQEVSQIIHREIKDPRVTGLITVTDVIVSRDLRNATIYVSILGDTQAHKSSMEGLKSSIGFIKRRLGEILSLKFIPDIRFKEDHSLQEGSELYRKLNQLEAGLELKAETVESDGTGSENKIRKDETEYIDKE